MKHQIYNYLLASLLCTIIYSENLLLENFMSNDCTDLHYYASGGFSCGSGESFEMICLNASHYLVRTCGDGDERVLETGRCNGYGQKVLCVEDVEGYVIERQGVLSKWRYYGNESCTGESDYVEYWFGGCFSAFDYSTYCEVTDGDIETVVWYDDRCEKSSCNCTNYCSCSEKNLKPYPQTCFMYFGDHIQATVIGDSFDKCKAVSTSTGNISLPETTTEEKTTLPETSEETTTLIETTTEDKTSNTSVDTSTTVKEQNTSETTEGTQTSKDEDKGNTTVQSSSPHLILSICLSFLAIVLY
eukprot:TRINITY_DN12035_c0_g1_i1.p1 TRINITY_DN12035_c0_g1~~TRINITY_DN12035_c0_g1_i1.p1  ORF type:complete len:301 (-),score=50.59 TRINITY_DN12035_c0_g1_i1:9-911(-)